jgi:hypothetical protein
MLRPGIITAGLLNRPLDLKELILLYDELWVPGISSGLALDGGESEDDKQFYASIDWLVAQEIIKEPPFKVNSGQTKTDEIIDSLKRIYSAAQRSLNRTYRTAESAPRHSGAAAFNMDLAVTRSIAYVLWRDRQETAFPVAFPFLDELAPGSAISKSQQVLKITLKRFPDPQSELSLEDVVTFKRDAGTKYKFAKFWHWMQRLAAGSTSAREIEEELEWLLADYTNHVEQTSKRARYDRLKIWITLPFDTLENLIKLKFGKVAEKLVDLKIASIAAHDEELKLPGSEIAYVKESIELLAPKSPTGPAIRSGM